MLILMLRNVKTSLHVLCYPFVSTESSVACFASTNSKVNVGNIVSVSYVNPE